VVVTPGQAGENSRLLDVLEAAGARVCRVVADKAYSHPSTRAVLRRRRIQVTIPERDDQIARRKAKGSAGSRPPDFDQAILKFIGFPTERDPSMPSWAQDLYRKLTPDAPSTFRRPCLVLGAVRVPLIGRGCPDADAQECRITTHCSN